VPAGTCRLLQLWHYIYSIAKSASELPTVGI